MAALADKLKFSRHGLSAAKAELGALEELDDCGILVVSKWWGSQFPVTLLHDLKPSIEGVELL